MSIWVCYYLLEATETRAYRTHLELQEEERGTQVFTAAVDVVARARGEAGEGDPIALARHPHSLTPLIRFAPRAPRTWETRQRQTRHLLDLFHPVESSFHFCGIHPNKNHCPCRSFSSLYLVPMRYSLGGRALCHLDLQYVPTIFGSQYENQGDSMDV